MRTLKLGLLPPLLAAAGVFTAAPGHLTRRSALRTIRLASLAVVAVAAAAMAAAPASVAALPTPMPRPTIGGIKPTYCPSDGQIAVTAAVEGGRTSFNVGDSVTFVVTMTAVSCDIMNTHLGLPPPGGRQIGPPLGGGLKGAGFNDYLLAMPAGNTFSHNSTSGKVVGTAVQAGTWTYTAQAVGYSFGTTDPGTGSGCAPDVEYGAGAGWSCPRSVQASVTIRISEPASPTPPTSTGSSQPGSSGSTPGPAGSGSLQPTPAQPVASSPSLAGSGGVRAAGRASNVSPQLVVALAVLMALALGGAGIVLIRRGLARRPRDGLEVTSGP